MKAIRPALVTAALGVALVACTTPPQAAPTQPTTGSTTTTATSTTTAPTTTTGAATPEAIAVDAADPTPLLDHGGLGAIRLGMTQAELEATGLVVRDDAPGEGATCALYHFKSLEGGVYVERETGRGVVSIIVDDDVRTPEGIRTGSTLKEAQAAFPGYVERVNWDAADLGGDVWYGFLGHPVVKGVLLYNHPRLCHD
jgi:hypothetical protein